MKEEDIFGKDFIQCLNLNLEHSGEMDWRLWALTSCLGFLLLLVLIFLLVTADCWPHHHHRRVKNLDSDQRSQIREVVDNNWENLWNCAKDVQVGRLKDGLSFGLTLVSIVIPGSSEFSANTKDCERKLFEEVQKLLLALPQTHSKTKDHAMQIDLEVQRRPPFTYQI